MGGTRGPEPTLPYPPAKPQSTNRGRKRELEPAAHVWDREQEHVGGKIQRGGTADKPLKLKAEAAAAGPRGTGVAAAGTAELAPRHVREGGRHRVKEHVQEHVKETPRGLEPFHGTNEGT